MGLRRQIRTLKSTGSTCRNVPFRVHSSATEESPAKRIAAEFFRTDSGNEPIRDELLRLGRPIKTQVGEDIRFVELNWRVDRPFVDRLRSGKGEFERAIYEVRHTVEGAEYRTLFFVFENRMVLVHFFQKKTRRTPAIEIALAWSRMKRWVSEQKRVR